MTNIIRDWNQAEGQAFQGDVSIIPVPASVKLTLTDQISPVGNLLILQEGETTGHHHAIGLTDRNVPDAINAQVERLMVDALSGRIPLPSAKLYRDPRAAEQMRGLGILTRTDLIVGLLIVEVGPMVLRHQEHDGIRIPPGVYLIGRQIESAGAEERMVRD